MSKILLANQTVAPDTPASGRTAVYSKSDGLYIRDDSGDEYALLPVPGSPSTGDLIYFNGSSWVRLAVGSQGAVLHVNSGLPAWTTLNGFALESWGNDNVASTTATRYMSPGYESTVAGTVAPSYPITRSVTAQRLFVKHGTPSGNGEPIVYTVRKNGTPTALSVSLASTGSTGSDTTHSVAFAAGDAIDIEITKASGIVASPSQVTAALELV